MSQGCVTCPLRTSNSGFQLCRQETTVAKEFAASIACECFAITATALVLGIFATRVTGAFRASLSAVVALVEDVLVRPRRTSEDREAESESEYGGCGKSRRCYLK